MSRALIFAALLLTAAATATPTTAASSSGDLLSSQRPNILLITADQLRYDSLGFSSGDRLKVATPAIDRLAHEGLVMAAHYSSTPTCTPARAALLTGQSPWRHGMLGYGNIAPQYPVEFPRVLARAGYITTSLGKAHYGWNATSNTAVDHGFQQAKLYDGLGTWNPVLQQYTEYGNQPVVDDYIQWFKSQLPNSNPSATLDPLDQNKGGWNDWHGRAFVYPEYYHPTAWLGRQAVDFISNYSSAEPFLLSVGFHRPHAPYDPPQRLLDKVKPEDVATPVTQGSGWDENYRTDEAMCSSKPDAWCGLMPANETLFTRRCYLASIMYIDEQVAEIVKSLERTGLIDNTWIIFTSDHGDALGDHFLWRKGYPYEMASRIPLVLRWPKSAEKRVTTKRGTVVTDLVSELRDIPHTIYDITGATSYLPEGFFASTDGKPLTCLLTDTSGRTCAYAPNPGPWRNWLDLEHTVVYNNIINWNALTDGTIKYIYWAYTGTEQLFNLTADPLEQKDLAAQPAYANILALWRSRLVAQFQRENRGVSFVSSKDELSRRYGPYVYAPNYPSELPIAGDSAVGVTQDSISRVTTWTCDQLTQNPSSLSVITFNYMLLEDKLCLQADGPLPMSLTVENCSANAHNQQFRWAATQGYVGTFKYNYNQLVHVASGHCLMSLNDGTMTVAMCNPGNALAQAFVCNSQNRLCSQQAGGRCLGVDSGPSTANILY